MEQKKFRPNWLGILAPVFVLLILGFVITTRAVGDTIPQIFLPLIEGSAKESSQQSTPTPRRSTTPQTTLTPGKTSVPPSSSKKYIVIAWNDLGMHCYNRDFQDLAVLPPYNNLWAQVIEVGNPPRLVTDGVTVSYNFPDNTYSTTTDPGKVNKSNFWTYAKKLFGVDLPANVGLKGKSLSGNMDLNGTHFVAEGIPITEYSDSNPTKRDPYQLANITVTNNADGKVLATNQVVAPVSTEMRCDNCHYNGAFGISTASIEQNILTLHDNKNASDYPDGHTGKLMDRRPVLCAECHSSNALGAKGVTGIPSLSNAMHSKHDGKVPNTTEGCYSCHPGPDTKCLRDVMSTQEGMTCISCHGTMSKVKQNTNPWLNEPRCDTCHKDSGFQQNNALYRLSTGHGGLYCEACHDSTHAIATSREPKDAIKFINLQGSAGTLKKCTVCHLTEPSGAGPHGK
jgi:hypothetical protein